MWRKIFTLSMLLSANLVRQIEASGFKVSGKLVFPKDGVYTHIPANSCLVVKVVEHILCDGQCDAPRLSGKSITHNVTFSSNIFEYEVTCEHLMLPYILSSRLHIGWCPSPDYKGPYIEKGDYENEFGYRFQMRGNEIEYNASDMKMVPYDSLGLCGTKQCDLKSESCQVNENGKAYCRCNVQGGCKTTTTTAIPTTTTTPPPTTTTTTPTTTTTTTPTTTTTTTTPTTTTTTPTTTTTTPTTTTTTTPTTTTTTPTTTTTTTLTTTTTTPTTTTTTTPPPTTTTTTPSTTTTTTTPTTTTTTTPSTTTTTTPPATTTTTTPSTTTTTTTPTTTTTTTTPSTTTTTTTTTIKKTFSQPKTSIFTDTTTEVTPSMKTTSKTASGPSPGSVGTRVLGGAVILPKEGVYPSSIYMGSCLHVKVWNKANCMDFCKKKVVAYLNLKHIKITNNKILYIINIDHLNAGEAYSVSAILNVGWCYSEQGKEQLQSNDYVSNTSNIFQIKRGGKYYHVNINMEKNENSGGGKSNDGKVGDKNYILISAIGGGGFLFLILLLVCVFCVCKGRKRANSENARRSNNTSAMGSLRKDRIMVDLVAHEYDKRQKAKENVYVDLPAYQTEAPPSYTVYEDEKPPIYDEIAAYKARVGIE